MKTASAMRADLSSDSLVTDVGSVLKGYYVIRYVAKNYI